MHKTTNSTIRLRAATLADARKLWEWRDEAATRSASYHSEPIPYEDHLHWLQEKLSSPKARFLIALNGDDEVGYARLDLNDAVAEISLTIDPRHRDKGLGTALIGVATRFALKELGLLSVIAHVKRDNLPSLTAFERAGFLRAATLKIAGHDSVRMIYPNDASFASKED